ncbi:MAG: peptidoglycan recognition family protein [Cyanobacteriota bacterium]|nr:peptidoglycan recognition family protein [Cyanobacteriota bacterium]
MTLPSQAKGVLMGMAGASLVASGMVLWLVRGAGGRPQADAPPSLLDILEEVRQPKPPRAPAPRRPPPPAPVRAEWSSPLGQACGVTDPALRTRLTRLLAALPARKQRLRIHPTNYGDRHIRDAFGNPLDPTPRVVVLHETVYGMGSAINTFLTPHPRDDDQVSYHVLVGEKGDIVETVDPDKRAFGAGNSAFGGQWAVTNPKVGGSVNNFALHLSLETPIDGEHQGGSHSGYSAAQYDALAVVLADWMQRFSIPPQAITTHRHVDLAGERADPRSFDWQELQARLAALGLAC